MAPGWTMVKIAMAMAMMISAGIITKFAFSMPFFTPRATTPTVMAINTSMKIWLATGEVMKLVKKAPDSPPTSAMLAAEFVT